MDLGLELVQRGQQAGNAGLQVLMWLFALDRSPQLLGGGHDIAELVIELIEWGCRVAEWVSIAPVLGPSRSHPVMIPHPLEVASGTRSLVAWASCRAVAPRAAQVSRPG